MREAHGDKYPTKKFLASANKQQQQQLQQQQKATGQLQQQQNANNVTPHAMGADNASPVAGLKRFDRFGYLLHLDNANMLH